MFAALRRFGEYVSLCILASWERFASTLCETAAQHVSQLTDAAKCSVPSKAMTWGTTSVPLVSYAAPTNPIGVFGVSRGSAMIAADSPDTIAQALNDILGDLNQRDARAAPMVRSAKENLDPSKRIEAYDKYLGDAKSAAQPNAAVTI